MKKFNLFTTYHKHKDPSRYAEYVFCLFNNMKMPFNSINFLDFYADNEEQTPFGILEIDDIIKKFRNEIKCEKYNFESVQRRPLYNDFFELMDNEKFKDDINILCNADIYFSDLECIHQHFSEGSKICLALSRWDFNAQGGYDHLFRSDSQDTWIFNGNPNFRTTLSYGMGKGGCDNRLAYDLEQEGFVVLNPSCSIKTYHHHLSNIRTWTQEEKIPPPYKLLNPY